MKPTRTRPLFPLVSSQSVISKKRKWEAIGPDISIQLCPRSLSQGWTGHRWCWISVRKQACVVVVVVVCLSFAAFSPKGPDGFPQNTKWFVYSEFLTSKPTRAFHKKGTLSHLWSCVPPLPTTGSSKWRLWEAVQHLPQTAHHQNGVSHQSELAWPIKRSSSLPHHSLSASLFLVQVCLCRRGWWVVGGWGRFIENSSSYTNCLSWNLYGRLFMRDWIKKRIQPLHQKWRRGSVTPQVKIN